MHEMYATPNLLCGEANAQNVASHVCVCVRVRQCVCVPPHVHIYFPILIAYKFARGATVINVQQDTLLLAP